MVWYGMVWYGMVWYGMVWYGMVLYGIWYGTRYTVYGMVWYMLYGMLYGIRYSIMVCLSSIYLPLRLNPRGGRQTGIPEYQVLRGLVETK